MKTLSNKLRSETGASFIIALLVFLICAVVASVIVMSASGNVERIQQHRAEEQAYLTMSSAAQMLQIDLSVNPSFTGIESKTIYECRGLGYDDEHQDLYPDPYHFHHSGLLYCLHPMFRSRRWKFILTGSVIFVNTLCLPIFVSSISSQMHRQVAGYYEHPARLLPATG